MRKTYAFCRELGGDVARDYKTYDFVQEAFMRLLASTPTRSSTSSVVAPFAKNFEAAAVAKRIVQIGFMDASPAMPNLRLLMIKRLVSTGSTL